MVKPPYREDRLRELIVYLAHVCELDPAFGAVKLNKLLFFTDHDSFRRRGMPITGADYFKLPNGPAPRRLVPVRKQLIDEGAVIIRSIEMSSGLNAQQKPIALRPAKLSIFEPDDIAFIDGVVRDFWGESGSRLSERTHQMSGWALAELHETIPYQAILVSSEQQDLDDDQLRRFSDILKERSASLA
jgi:hypothetical protein